MSRHASSIWPISLSAVYNCKQQEGTALAAFQAGAQYKYIARVRADVRWGSFPSPEELGDPDVDVWINYEPWPIQPPFSDQFAVGRVEPMLRFLEQYSFYADSSNWHAADRFFPGGKWCESHLAEDRMCKIFHCENLLEAFMLASGLRIRKHRQICFDRLRACGRLRTRSCAQEGNDDPSAVDANMGHFFATARTRLRPD